MAKTFKQLLNTDLIPEMSDIGSSASGWKLVTKASGAVLESSAVNASTMSSGALTFKLPAAITDKPRQFILTVKIDAKYLLTIQNNDGSAFTSYVFDQNDSDPFIAFAATPVGVTAQLTFLEIMPGTFKVSYSVARTATSLHKVTFNSMGGSAVDAQWVEDGQSAEQPADPTQTGYIFQYWCSDESCLNRYTFGAVTADITLYAKWALPEVVSVSFNSYGGTAVSTQNIYKGQKAETPNTPTKTDATFSGWYTSDAYTTKWNFDDPVESSMTLHAKWVSGTDWTTFDPSVLTVGQELTAPSAYGFDKIVFEVVDKNNVTVAGKSNTVTLQTKFCLTTQNSEHYHRTFSDSNSQIWESSTIKTWLNTETAPTTIRGNFLGSFLLDSSGNPKTGSDLAQAQAFIAAIQKPTLKTYTSASAYNEVATCKVWLPSVKQMGGGTPTYNWGVENACLQKYTGIEGTGSNTTRAKTTTFSSSCYYWCRSAYSGYSAGVWFVNTDGSLIYGNIANYGGGVAPLITFAY